MKYLNGNNEFDGIGWVTDVQKYERNTKALNCKAVVKIKSLANNEATVDVKLINVPSKYAKAMTELATNISQGAFQWILISFSYSVAMDDVATESKKVGKIISSISEGLINTLLSNGLKEFKNAIRDRVNLVTAQYELSRMTCKNGQWKRWNGDTWDGSQWINSKGEAYSDNAAIYLSKIVKVV